MPKNGKVIVPPSEVTLATTPLPRFRIAGSKPRISSSCPNRFTWKTCSTSSAEAHSTGPHCSVPALFSSTSGQPCSATTRSASEAADPGTAKSSDSIDTRPATRG